VDLSLAQYLKQTFSDARRLFEVKKQCQTVPVPLLDWEYVFNIPRFDLKWWLSEVYPKIKNNYPERHFIPLLMGSVNMNSEVMKLLLIGKEEELTEYDFNPFFSNQLKKDFNYSSLIITTFLRKVKTVRCLASLRGLRVRLPDDLVEKIISFI
jgi:hypothetical protein